MQNFATTSKFIDRTTLSGRLNEHFVNIIRPFTPVKHAKSYFKIGYHRAAVMEAKVPYKFLITTSSRDADISWNIS